MQISMSSALTVFHDGDFWVGLAEHVEDGRYGLGRIVFGDALHEAGLTAAAYAGDDLDYPVVMVEAADLLQIVFTRKQTHTGSNLHWSQYIKSYVYRGIFYQRHNLYPHN